MADSTNQLLAGLPAAIRRAAENLGGRVRRTPVDRLTYFDGECEIFAKLENLQYTGSFKLRGAFNKMLTMTADSDARACVTASTGNHGMACAWAADALGLDVTVFVPEDAAQTKLNGIRRLGAEIRVAGEDCGDTERIAREWAQSQGLEYISPYNDPAVIAGQGTVGCEMAEQMEPADIVCVAVGGGGLMSGVAAYLAEAWPAARIVGCQPANSPVMERSVAAGHIVEWPSEPTLSDGTAGGMEPGSITFDLCRELVDEYMLINEAEIAAALNAFVDGHHMLIEGAAAVALAAAQKLAGQQPGARLAVVVCGANIDRGSLARVLSSE
jgi:threonine dehydratase